MGRRGREGALERVAGRSLSGWLRKGGGTQVRAGESQNRRPPGSGQTPQNPATCWGCCTLILPLGDLHTHTHTHTHTRRMHLSLLVRRFLRGCSGPGTPQVSAWHRHLAISLSAGCRGGCSRGGRADEGASLGEHPAPRRVRADRGAAPGEGRRPPFPRPLLLATRSGHLSSRACRVLATLRSPRPRDNTLPAEAARPGGSRVPQPREPGLTPHREPLDTNSTGVALTASRSGSYPPSGQ